MYKMYLTYISKVLTLEVGENFLLCFDVNKYNKSYI